MVRLLPALALIAVLGAASAATGQNETDGLMPVDWRGFDEASVAPGANLSQYTKVMFEPSTAAFRHDWLRDYNDQTLGLENRISDEEAEDILQDVRTALDEVFAEEYAANGYEVATAPGPDVLLVRAMVTDFDVNAPDLMRSARNRSYAREAGEATLVLEVRDATSGALLARAIDEREVGELVFVTQRSSVSNRGDFRRAFRSWARMSARELNETHPPEAARPVGSH